MERKSLIIIGSFLLVIVSAIIFLGINAFTGIKQVAGVQNQDNFSLVLKILPHIKTKIENKTLAFEIDGDTKQARSNWGTMRALAQNAVIGVNEGFSKNMEIEGVGYRALMDGNNLILNLGFSHPIKITPPVEIIISVEKNVIKVSGIDKGLVGKIASNIRAMKKPEPYKGKGIRYQGEFIRRKEGKKAAGATK